MSARAHLVAFVARHKILALLIVAALFIGVAGATMNLGAASVVSVDPQTDENAAGYTGHVELKGSQRDQYITSGEIGYKSQVVTAQGVLVPDATNNFGLLGGGNLCQYQYRVFTNEGLGARAEQPIVPDGGDVAIDPNTHQGAFVSPTIGFSLPGGRAITNQIPLEAYTFTVNGKVEGAVRVELWGFLGTGLHRQIGPCDSWFRIGYDGAQLIDGSAGIHIADGQSDRFQEGDTVRFAYHSGFGHWTVAMYDGAGHLACGLNAGGGFNPLALFQSLRFTEFEAGDNPLGSVSTQPLPTGDAGASSTDPTVASLPSGAGPDTDAAAVHCKAELQWDGKQSGTITYVIPKGAFVKGGNNVWRISLANTRTEHGADQLVVLDQRVLAPEPPTVQIKDPRGDILDDRGANCTASGCTPPNVGDTLTYSMTTRLNLLSNSPVDHCLVYAWYGTTDITPATDSPAWIVRGASAPATPVGQFNYSCSYPLTITKPEQIHSRLYAVDKDGRPSGSTLNAPDTAEAQQAAYTPPPNSTASASGAYDTPMNTNSRPVVSPQGSQNTASGPTDPPVDHSGQAFLLLVALVLVTAFLVLVLPKWPLPIKIGVVALVIVLGAAYAAYTGTIPGVS